MTVAINIILLLILLILCIILTMLAILMINSLLRGHDLPTSRRATRAVCKIISEYPQTKNFYDLGCAHGIFSIRLKKRFPDISVRAIDNDRVRIFFAKLVALLFKSPVLFSRNDIFEEDLRDADIVYTYLWYDHMPPLEKKLQKELKPGTLVITNTSNFPTWKPIRKIETYPEVSDVENFETLFVYRKE